MKPYTLSSQPVLQVSLTPPEDDEVARSKSTRFALVIRLVSLALLSFSLILNLILLLLPSKLAHWSVLTIQPTGTQLAPIANLTTNDNGTTSWLVDGVGGTEGGTADEGNMDTADSAVGHGVDGPIVWIGIGCASY